MFSLIDMVKTLAQRIMQILDDQQINQSQLADAAGCTRGRVNQWINENKPDAVLSPRFAYPIAEKYGYEPRWLMLGEGNERSPESLNHRFETLTRNYIQADERGREVILMVAEREASYSKHG
jgi:transcriptional regulator with XRE-family HTH domain